MTVFWQHAFWHKVLRHSVLQHQILDIDPFHYQGQPFFNCVKEIVFNEVGKEKDIIQKRTIAEKDHYQKGTVLKDI